MMRKSVWASCIAAVAAFNTGVAGLYADQLWSVHGGTTVILLDSGALSELGLRVESTDPVNFPSPEGQITFPVAFDTDEFVLQGYSSNDPQFANGELHHRDGVALIGPGGRVVIQDLMVGAVQGSLSRGATADQLLATSSIATFDKNTAKLAVQCDSLIISRALATALGVPAAAGRSIGGMQTNAEMVYMGGDPLPPSDDLPAPHICTNPTTGPDVIVGDMPAIANYTPFSGIDAFAVATTSCNMGNVTLLWQSGNTNHPVIPQHMYRMKTVDGSVRFEQIGLSWMKHGFTALAGNVCCTCTNPGTGALLGTGCSDPYSSTRNGTQVTTTGGCGPRFQTNPHTGGFVWPYMFRGTGTMGGGTDPNSISRRVQVPLADVNPALNTGATYYVETQYITPDDAAAKNQNNNSSYRLCTITGDATNTNATVAGTTVRQKAAIQAWKTADPSVTETIIDTPEDNSVVNFPGRGILSAKATSLGGGVWHYEYALYNMNSDRGFTTFTVPVASSYSVTNIGFHDVSYHSGDGFGTAVGALVTIDGTDWPGVFAANTVKWDCPKLLAPANINNSNYLRWGTTYNFRFDANAPPTTGNITVDFFKVVAGQPDTMLVSTVVPQACAVPSINPITAQNATCASPFTSSAPTAAGTAPFTWSIASGGEAGMTIAPATGVVSWPNPVPSLTGYDVTIQVSNCSASLDTEVMHIDVPFAADPVIDPIAPQNATCGTAFTSATPTGSGLAGATWSITLGGQPGMTIDSSGVISWPAPVPNAAPYNVTIQASNACAANAASTVVSITVTSAGGAITIDPIAPDATVCGVPYTSAIPTASGGTVPYNWSISGAPVGMTINPSNGQVSWPVPVISPTPYSITLEAGDNCGATSGTATLSLTVRLGDFDGDGLVTVSDVPGFIDHLLGVSTSSSCAGDMNADTFIDGSDVQGFVSQL